MPSLPQKLTAIGYFKDWSNYVLITTVAAIGWIAKDTGIEANCRAISLLAFGGSTILGILTLAVIPRVAESLKEDDGSFYDVKAVFNLGWVWSFWPITLSVKHVCWPQHVLFFVGIVFYIVGAI